MNNEKIVTPEQLLEKQMEEADKDIKKILIITIIAIIILILTILIITNNQLPNYQQICGPFKNPELWFNHVNPQEPNQLICVFDNHVMPFIDINGEQWTNPEYKVCYRLFSNIGGEWIFAGQTC